MARILIVDDEAHVCRAFQRFLQRLGHEVTIAPSAEKGLQALSEKTELVLMDFKLPGMSGLEALEAYHHGFSELPIILITAHTTADVSIEAMRRHAFEVLGKPVDLKKLARAVDRALSVNTARTVALAEQHPSLLVGTSPRMVECYKRIALVAASNATVLLSGESGTGKELAARTIHRFSERHSGPFEAVNCGALPDNLLESELFGYEKGAFTGAHSRFSGRLRMAEGGTVFLDEIGELSSPAQVKLLRFIEERKVRPLGGSKAVPVSVRLMAATHRELHRLVEAGKFRQDLYFRLNVFRVDLPSLSERREDIALLTAHFLRALDPGEPRLGKETLRCLESRDWPGNVRELKNAIEHAWLLARGGVILPEHLPDERPASRGPEELVRRLAGQLLDDAECLGGEEKPYYFAMNRLERTILEIALSRHKGNLAQTARFLGIQRLTLRRKIKSLGVEV